MKIAYITTKPARLESGSEVRNYHLLKALIDEKKVTELKVIYGNNQAKESDIAHVHPKIKLQLFRLPKRNSLSSALAFGRGDIPYISHLIKHPFQSEIAASLAGVDLVVISELDGYFLASQALTHLPRSVKVVLDCHNVDYLRFRGEIVFSSVIKKVLGGLRLTRLQQLEIEAIKRADIVLTCSDFDRDYFQKHAATSIEVVPNGVDVAAKARRSVRLESSDTADAQILFMGQLSYPPNQDALQYYIKQIHSQVIAQHPGAKLLVLGKNPPAWLAELGQKDTSIKVLGFVPNVEPYLQQADVCICPLRAGSGTRLKILEYLLAAKPVVTTSIGSEGLEVEDQKHLLVADTPADFAQSVCTVIQDKKLAGRLGNAGQQLVMEKYNWQKIRNQFGQLVTADDQL